MKEIKREKYEKCRWSIGKLADIEKEMYHCSCIYSEYNREQVSDDLEKCNNCDHFFSDIDEENESSYCKDTKNLY